MPWIDKRVQCDEQDAVVFDDGGSGLFDACIRRFKARGWTVTCDAQHTVWVRDPVSGYSAGLARWLVDRQALDAILERTEARITRAQAAARA